MNETSSNNMTLYFFPASPPCRSVLMLAKALGINMNLSMIDIMSGEQMKESFLQINPMHTVPTLNDNGFILWESRAILQYLADQYGKDESLSPKEAKKSALVLEMMYFDGTTLLPRLRDYFMPVFKNGQQPNNESRAKLEEALKILDQHLERRRWCAGDELTIADFAIVATIATAEAVQIEMNDYRQIKRWLNDCRNAMRSFGYDEINERGAKMIGDHFKAQLNKVRY